MKVWSGTTDEWLARNYDLRAMDLQAGSLIIVDGNLISRPNARIWSSLEDCLMVWDTKINAGIAE